MCLDTYLQIKDPYSGAILGDLGIDLIRNYRYLIFIADMEHIFLLYDFDISYRIADGPTDKEKKDTC